MKNVYILLRNIYALLISVTPHKIIFYYSYAPLEVLIVSKMGGNAYKLL